MAVKKSGKFPGFMYTNIFNTVHLQKLKGMQYSELGM